MTESLEEIRRQYRALASKHYFNYGAQGVLHDSTIDAIHKAYEYVQENGPLSDAMFAWIEREITETRKLLAGEFGGSPDSYAITQSTTDGCNIVLWGIDWKAGDHLLLADCEHPGVVAAAKNIADRFAVNLSYAKLAGLSDDDAMVQAIVGSFTAKTRILVISHVLWNTGTILPVARIAAECRKRDIRLLVDGAQSAGVLPLNLRSLEADFYAFTGHKWMCGPEGVGVLYIHPEGIDALKPTFVGWRSIRYDGDGGFRPGAPKFEVATAPFPLLSGFRQAMAVHGRVGTAQQRYKILKANVDSLKESFSSNSRIKLVSAWPETGLVSFNIEDRSPRQVVDALAAGKVVVRTIPTPQAARASIHYLSSPEDLAALESQVLSLCDCVPS